MTVHAITAVADAPTDLPEAEARRLVEDFLAQFDQTLPDEQLRLRRVTPRVGEAPPHFRGRYRFPLTVPHKTVLDGLADALAATAGVDWYQLQYHECDHDEPADQRGVCTPTVTHTAGPIPDGV